MKFNKRVSLWSRELLRKRRVSVRSTSDNSEEWHIFISPLSLFSGFVAFLLVTFVIILTLVAYTPVLEFIPGYNANRSREILLKNIMRLDSIEQKMNTMRIYSDNIALIMEGKTPVLRNIINGHEIDSMALDKRLVLPSREDSILRAQMQGGGEYGLNTPSSKRSVREALELNSPIEGAIIIEKFNIKSGAFGVKTTSPSQSQIKSIDKGTVIMSLWSPNTGYTVQIQHPNNLVSIYKNMSQTTVVVGQRVKQGETLGYSGDTSAEGNKQRLFGFEIWSNGKPIDPESYIVF